MRVLVVLAAVLPVLAVAAPAQVPEEVLVWPLNGPEFTFVDPRDVSSVMPGKGGGAAYACLEHATALVYLSIRSSGDDICLSWESFEPLERPLLELAAARTPLGQLGRIGIIRVLRARTLLCTLGGGPPDGSQLTFDSIAWDPEDPASLYGVGRMVGNVGEAPVHAIRGSGSVSLIEVTPAGNVNVMTVFGQPVAPPDDRVAGDQMIIQNAHYRRAVYSRHTVIFGTVMPSQVEGYCAVL